MAGCEVAPSKDEVVEPVLGHDEHHSEVDSWKSAMTSILWLGWPNSVNMFLTFFPSLAMFYFLSSDADEVAAAGMGFMFSNVAGLSLIIGTGAGAQPLISQAFGAGNYVRCGDLLQRQFAIHLVLLIVIFAIWLNTEHILVFFKQPPAISALAGEFVKWRLAALPAIAIKEDVCSYLIAQRVMQLPMLVSIVAALSNLLGFVVLIPKFGYIGAPLAYTTANVIQAALLLVLGPCVLPEKSAWPQWNVKAACHGWMEMLRLAMPGGVLMLSEWLGWEINLLFAGLLCTDATRGCVQLDTFPIVANTMVICFMPNFGFSQAAGALVGNALGANQPRRARQVAHLAICIATCVGGSVACLLILVRNSWAFLFSSDKEIVDLTARTLPTVAAYIFLDNLGPGALISILRAMSVVFLPAVVNFVAFYVIGIPFGLMLTFGRSDENWGIIGLWSGLVLAMFILVCSLMIIVCYFTDWDKVATAAQSTALEVKPKGADKYKIVSAKSQSDLEQQTPIGKKAYDSWDDDDDLADAETRAPDSPVQDPTDLTKI